MKIGRIELSNKICISPGSYPSEVSFPYAGGIFSKTITLEKTDGNAGEVLRNIDIGTINRVGLTNSGLRGFLKKDFYHLKSLNNNIFVSVTGHNIEEIIELCAVISFEIGTEISGIEINLSCPNKEFNFELNEDYVHDVIFETKKTLRDVYDVPLIVKLPPWPDHIVKLGRAAKNADVDAVTATNTIKSLHFDDLFKPIFGGMSGEALKPIALRCIYELKQNIDIPIFGVGGVLTYKDVKDFFEAGASAVQLCTAEINKPGTLINILKELG